MSLHHFRCFALGGLVALLALPTTSQAQTFVSGNVGVAFGGNTSDERPLTFGGGVGVFGQFIGVEVDATHTRDFFTDSPLLDANSVTTMMANVLVGPRLGRIRPYAAGGVGLMRLHLEGPLGFGDFTSNDLGINAGGGVMVFLGPAVGLRGDVRYFRTVNGDGNFDFDLDLGDLDFWRASVGLVVAF